MTESGTEDEAGARRRRRTEAYFAMWGVPATIPTDVLAVPCEPLAFASAAAVRGRALANCVMALRGQGLSQLESFAFADAYHVWEHLTFEENQFLLTEEPLGDEMLQAAWRYERLWVHLWALDRVRHLVFADTQVDTARAIEMCISEVALVRPADLRMREPKELLDAADIAWCASVIERAASTPMQSDVVHERAVAFDEIAPGWRS